MTEPDLVGLFVAPLETLGVDYMITGGVASVIYGDPRFTRDIDLVLELREGDAGSLLDGFSPDDFYRPPLEVLREEIRRPRHGHGLPGPGPEARPQGGRQSPEAWANP